MGRKAKITARCIYDELVRFAEIGEAVAQQLPGLVALLLRRRGHKKRAGNGAAAREATVAVAKDDRG